jgi:hypothetical protein
LATDHLPEIGETIANSFRSHGMPATVRLLDVDREGWKATVLERRHPCLPGTAK